MRLSSKQSKRMTRHKRVRAKIAGTSERPRLAVFRSNRHITLQLIDDQTGRSIVQLTDLKLKTRKKLSKSERAYETGRKLAEAAKKKKITKVVFDRGGYKYHGRVKAAAEGARKGGLVF
jgi:large subunit ribosomal protein L18